MDNNPLKQYFRRPAVYIKLPSGGIGYPPGSLDMSESGELPVYPTTAIDEITTRTPDALFNGTAIVELIRSCIPNIKDPWAVPNTDLDAILVAIKTASSSSGEMDVDSTCPECSDTSTFKVNLSAILTSIGSPDYSTVMEVGELKIKLKSISFKDVNKASMEQFEFQRTISQLDSIQNEEERNIITANALTRITDLTMELICHSIEYIETPSMKVDQREFILDFLRHCDRNLYISIRDRSAEFRQVSEIKPMKMTCGSCNHAYEQTITLNPTDFFE
jgi:hypothetical protein